MKQFLKLSSAAVIGLAFVTGCKEEPTPSTPTTKPSMPSTTQPSAAVSDATGAASSAANDAVGKAQSLVTQVTEYIKDKKWDLADETLKKLEGMKDSLPAEWKDKIDGLRKTFDTAKAAGNISIPGLPGTK